MNFADRVIPVSKPHAAMGPARGAAFLGFPHVKSESAV
jgi:hypothetical protein